VRLILKTLVRKFKELGGELRLRATVEKLAVRERRVSGVVLEGGETIEAKNVLSSAGWLETLRLCEDVSQPDERQAGQLSFVESIAVLDAQPRAIGCDKTVIFYNDSPRFHWEKPAALIDPRSGVICSPNNFVYDEPLAEGVMRVTTLANYDLWRALPEPEYRLQKLRSYDAALASAVRFTGDFRSSMVAVDMFTPTTIRRFTGHENGAVYGAPVKRYNGQTHLENLFVCGTDQGYVGIVGSIMSGISIANTHLLKTG
jgi:phytoene dehydrogenase-like protein